MDLVIKYNTPQELFTAICNKIRDKTNSNELINHQDIPNRIDEIFDNGIKEEYNELLVLIEGTNNTAVINNDKIENFNISFKGCATLTTVNLPKCTSIGDYAFVNCIGLTTVNLPECTTIGRSAFGSNINLTINLPKCTFIRNEAFYGGNNLTIILANDQVAILENYNVFRFFTSPCYIYVPDNLVDLYKTAENWSAYADNIKPISELPSELKEEYGYE